MENNNNNRWCIIAGPRTGSHYLEDLIFNNLPKTTELPAVKLGEFLQDSWISYVDSNDKSISAQYEIDSEERNKYIQNVILSWNNKEQSFVLRIFLLPHLINKNKLNFETIYTIIDKLVKNNFKFIYLKRKRIDQLLSLVVAKKTNKWLRQKNIFENISVFFDIEKYCSGIFINETDFIREYFYLKNQEQLTEHVLNISKISVLTINYENLKNDCFNLHIPISDHSTYIKTYDMPYDKLIKNYNDLIELFESLENYGSAKYKQTI